MDLLNAFFSFLNFSIGLEPVAASRLPVGRALLGLAGHRGVHLPRRGERGPGMPHLIPQDRPTPEGQRSDGREPGVHQLGRNAGPEGQEGGTGG